MSRPCKIDAAVDSCPVGVFIAVRLDTGVFGHIHSTLSHVLSVNRSEKFRFKVNMYKLKEEREIEPRTLAHLVSSTLYERR
jgi:hypothetical protein